MESAAWYHRSCCWIWQWLVFSTGKSTQGYAVYLETTREHYWQIGEEDFDWERCDYSCIVDCLALARSSLCGAKAHSTADDPIPVVWGHFATPFFLFPT